jgi:hypothetical protein
VKDDRRIKNLYQTGYIKDKEEVLFLSEQLRSPNLEDRELAARTIIEEVVGSKYARLRLRALDILLSLPKKGVESESLYRGQIDLHTHSTAFDGYSTPTALILEAYEKGLIAIAITDHNKSPFDENIEAEKAAKKLDFCFYKGSEISADFYSDNTQKLETVHILDIPAHPPKSPRSLLKAYTREFSNLGFLSGLLFPLIRKSALIYTDYCTQKQVKKMLGRFITQYGHFFKLSEEDLVRVSRGDIPIPFTIALALWKKYQDVLSQQINIPDKANGIRTLAPLGNPHEVYKCFLANPDGSRTHKKKSGPPPDLFGMGELALALDHKLILAHPNEYPVALFEEAIEKSALVKLKNGRVYAGVFIGVEYYSHKLQGDYKEYVALYVDWLNKTHPVYKDFPLYLFPGSDTHGKYSPDRPLGLGYNYPSNRDIYNQEITKALRTKPKELSTDQTQLLLTRQKISDSLPPALRQLREKLP